MKIQLLKSNDESICAVDGEITIVYMRNINYIKSTLISSLIQSKNKIIICELSKSAQSTLNMCSVDKLLNIVRSVEDAKRMIESGQHMMERTKEIINRNNDVSERCHKISKDIKGLK